MKKRVAILCAIVPLLLAACGAADQSNTQSGAHPSSAAQASLAPTTSTKCSPKPCAVAVGVTVTVRALRFSVTDWSKALGSGFCAMTDFTASNCQNDDILLLLPTLTYAGTSSFTYNDSYGVSLVDNVSRTVLANEKCPGTYDFGQGFASKWPCSNIGYGQTSIEMRSGAKITPGWVSWLMPSKDFAVGPTFEIGTLVEDPNSSTGFFKIQVPIEPIPARTSP